MEETSKRFFKDLRQLTKALTSVKGMKSIRFSNNGRSATSSPWFPGLYSLLILEPKSSSWDDSKYRTLGSAARNHVAIIDHAKFDRYKKSKLTFRETPLNDVVRLIEQLTELCSFLTNYQRQFDGIFKTGSYKAVSMVNAIPTIISSMNSMAGDLGSIAARGAIDYLFTSYAVLLAYIDLSYSACFHLYNGTITAINETLHTMHAILWHKGWQK